MSAPDDHTIEKRAPGRPRSPQTRAAIVDAAAVLFDTLPYRDISIDRIAAEAKVGKQSIYRWWTSKADLLLDAHLERLAAEAPVQARSGDALADLEALLKQTYVALEAGPSRNGLRCLIAEAQFDDAFCARLHDVFFQRSRSAITDILNDGRAIGQLRPGLNLDSLIDIVVGALWYRVLAGSRSQICNVRYAEAVVDMVRAIASAGPAVPRSPAEAAMLFEP